MSKLKDRRLGVIELDEEGYGEVDLMVDGVAIKVTIDAPNEGGEGRESDVLRHAPKDLVAAARRAIASDDHEDVALYLTHHFEEFDSGELDAILGEGTEHTAEALRGALGPIAIHLDPSNDDEPVTVDVGFGLEVSNYVLAVRFDAAGVVAEVDMES